MCTCIDRCLQCFRFSGTICIIGDRVGDGYAYTHGRMHTQTHACTHISTSIFVVVVIASAVSILHFTPDR